MSDTLASPLYLGGGMVMSKKIKNKLLAHHRDMIYFEEWFWGCEHKKYTDKEVLEWARRANEKKTKNNEDA